MLFIYTPAISCAERRGRPAKQMLISCGKYCFGREFGQRRSGKQVRGFGSAEEIELECRSLSWRRDLREQRPKEQCTVRVRALVEAPAGQLASGPELMSLFKFSLEPASGELEQRLSIIEVEEEEEEGTGARCASGVELAAEEAAHLALATNVGRPISPVELQRAAPTEEADNGGDTGSTSGGGGGDKSDDSESMTMSTNTSRRRRRRTKPKIGGLDLARRVSRMLSIVPRNPLANLLAQEQASCKRHFMAMISYNHSEGREFATKLKAALLSVGVSVYLDVDEIKMGSDWQDSLNEAILHCRAFVPLVTPSYGRTLWTGRELKLADVLAKHIIPVNFGQPWPPPTLAIQFATLQYIHWQPAGCGPGARPPALERTDGWSWASARSVASLIRQSMAERAAGALSSDARCPCARAHAHLPDSGFSDWTPPAHSPETELILGAGGQGARVGAHYGSMGAARLDALHGPALHLEACADVQASGRESGCARCSSPDVRLVLSSERLDSFRAKARARARTKAEAKDTTKRVAYLACSRSGGFPFGAASEPRPGGEGYQRQCCECQRGWREQAEGEGRADGKGRGGSGRRRSLGRRVVRVIKSVRYKLAPNNVNRGLLQEQAG